MDHIVNLAIRPFRDPPHHLWANDRVDTEARDADQTTADGCTAPHWQCSHATKLSRGSAACVTPLPVKEGHLLKVVNQPP
jgi:hypothetical protein